jgi:hypothetical protein
MKRAMNRWIALVLLAVLAVWQLPAQAQPQPRVYNQAELDALLAPVALYPDAVLSNILVASAYPDDLGQAAAWSRANPQLAGDTALQAAEPMPWHPSVKSLVAFPDLLARMNDSPQWIADLGAAFREQEPYVMDTVQRLRSRAQANGSLQSNDQYTVDQQGSSIAVYPAQPQVVYVPYYDPYVVYGTWWWPAYRPVFWRPWHLRPAVFFTRNVFVRSVDWRQRQIVRPTFQGQAHQVARNIQPQPVIQSHPQAQPYIQSRGQPYIQNHTAPASPIVDSSRPRPQPWGQRVEQGREFHREAPRTAPQAPVAIPSQPPMRSIAATVRNQVQQSSQPQVMRSVAATVRNQVQQSSHPQVMRSIAATVRNQAQQPPHGRGPSGHAPQGDLRMESRGGNFQRR